MPHPPGSPSLRSVYIALGSNQDDPARRLRDAVLELERSEALRNVRVSSVYRTAPVGPVQDQPDFLNAAAVAESDWSPLALLTHLHEIEARLGLDRAAKQLQGPRVIDLDLLMVGDLVHDTETLRLPHPGLAKRRFVLEPLAELAPDAVDPLSGRTIAQLLESL